MWKDEILEAIDKEVLKTYKNRANFILSLKQNIQKSEVFYFGEMSGIKDALLKEQDKDYMFSVKFPYDKIIYEFRNNSEKAYRVENDSLVKVADYKTRTAYYITSVDDVFGIFPFAKIEGREWILPWFHTLADTKRKTISIRNISEEERDYKKYSDMMMFAHQQAIALTQIINCQNVITKDVVPPEKLNRKRIRNGKLPLYTYKILEVVKGKPKSKDGGTVPWDYKSPANVRFHLCRGHFKTFTPDKPLFGKYSGTFWWNPQSRGNKELGEIEKDYDVKVV